jgi:hypothetical protein
VDTCKSRNTVQRGSNESDRRRNNSVGEIHFGLVQIKPVRGLFFERCRQRSDTIGAEADQIKDQSL